jgi:hypothetical protein
MGVDAQATTFMSLLVLRLIKGVCIIDTFIVVCTIHSVLHLLSLPPSLPPSLSPSLSHTNTHTLSLFTSRPVRVGGKR